MAALAAPSVCGTCKWAGSSAALAMALAIGARFSLQNCVGGHRDAGYDSRAGLCWRCWDELLGWTCCSKHAVPISRTGACHAGASGRQCNNITALEATPRSPPVIAWRCSAAGQPPERHPAPPSRSRGLPASERLAQPLGRLWLGCEWLVCCNSTKRTPCAQVVGIVPRVSHCDGGGVRGVQQI